MGWEGVRRKCKGRGFGIVEWRDVVGGSWGINGVISIECDH